MADKNYWSDEAFGNNYNKKCNYNYGKTPSKLPSLPSINYKKVFSRCMFIAMILSVVALVILVSYSVITRIQEITKDNKYITVLEKQVIKEDAVKETKPKMVVKDRTEGLNW